METIYEQCKDVIIKLLGIRDYVIENSGSFKDGKYMAATLNDAIGVLNEVKGSEG